MRSRHTWRSHSVGRLNKSTRSLCWLGFQTIEAVRGVFARQAIPMVWDFAEANPFGGAAGDPGEDC